MRIRRFGLLFCMAIGLSYLTVGCEQDADNTPTAAFQPTAALEVTPAESPVPTSAPTATSTTIGPGPTLTPRPTATLPVAPTITAPPPPVLLLAPSDFGADRNPLTGELVDDERVLDRRPIAIKISNSPPEYVRPQSGLGQADLVFEHVTEGPITRFTALFYSQTPPNVGPIRSARLIDVELPAMLDAALAYSGSSIGVSQKLFSSDFVPRILRSSEPGYYRTGEDKPYEHTLYGRPALFWEALAEKGENRRPALSTYMAFGSESPEGGEPAREAIINYRDWTIVDWRFDESNGRYWRWADGVEHIDANDDTQISAANVIILFAIHQQDVSICEYQVEDQCYAFSTEIQIWGQGPAIILRDGRQYEVVWKRESRPDMFTFWDSDGEPLPLQLGNSWFQVVPRHYTDPVTITQ